MKRWMRQHRYAVGAALANLGKAPGSFLFNVVVVAIARAIVNRPQIILADEPTANLDRASADKVLDALRAFHAAGVTCVIATHDEQVLDGAARVLHLAHGQLVQHVQPVQPVQPEQEAP